MNDQEQPEVPQTPITPPVPAVPEIDSANKLEDLPPPVRDILDFLVKEGYGSHKIKSELEKKVGPVGDILPAARSTYERYIEKHHDRLSKEKQTEDKLLSSLKEDGGAVNGFVDTALKGNKLSKIEEIENLKRFIINRIAFLERSQASGIPSAQLENTMSSYVNGLRTILEKTIEYGEELNKDTTNTLRSYLMATIDEWISKTLTIYKKVHGDFKLVEFSTELESSLKEILTAQLLEIETEDDQAK